MGFSWGVCYHGNLGIFASMQGYLDVLKSNWLNYKFCKKITYAEFKYETGLYFTFTQMAYLIDN